MKIHVDHFPVGFRTAFVNLDIDYSYHSEWKYRYSARVMDAFADVGPVQWSLDVGFRADDKETDPPIWANIDTARGRNRQFSAPIVGTKEHLFHPSIPAWVSRIASCQVIDFADSRIETTGDRLARAHSSMIFESIPADFWDRKRSVRVFPNSVSDLVLELHYVVIGNQYDIPVPPVINGIDEFPEDRRCFVSITILAPVKSEYLEDSHETQDTT